MKKFILIAFSLLFGAGHAFSQASSKKKALVYNYKLEKFLQENKERVPFVGVFLLSDSTVQMITYGTMETKKYTPLSGPDSSKTFSAYGLKLAETVTIRDGVLSNYFFFVPVHSECKIYDVDTKKYYDVYWELVEKDREHGRKEKIIVFTTPTHEIQIGFADQ